jgi:RNA polymerase sigma-70 factor (ECF subfamily)
VTAPDRAAVEADARRRVGGGDLAGAVDALLRCYGDELMGYLHAMLRDEQAAGDTFAEVCVHVWRDLPAFRWEASARTWIYTIARHRIFEAREVAARRRRLVPLSRSPEVDALNERARTATRSYLHDDVRAQVAAARAALDPDDQTLLILRVDRDMSWRDVGAVLGVPAATVRKRYERVKQRLRELLDNSA